jgi:hypothetical protein
MGEMTREESESNTTVHVVLSCIPRIVIQIGAVPPIALLGRRSTTCWPASRTWPHGDPRGNWPGSLTSGGE